MANEMYTNRQGKMVPVPEVVLPSSTVVTLLRLKEDFEQRGEHLSMLGVVLDVCDKGVRQVKNQWKNGDINKNRRMFSKEAAPYMRNPAKYAAEISQLAVKWGLVEGSQVDLSDPTEEVEEETQSVQA
jgi:hypothetical protein